MAQAGIADEDELFPEDFFEAHPLTPAEAGICELCGFPLASFKHRSLSDKQILGHEPQDEPEPAGRRARGKS